MMAEFVRSSMHGVHPKHQYFSEPVLISVTTGSLERVSGDFLTWNNCTVTMRVYVPPRGQGLRGGPTFRYLLAHGSPSTSGKDLNVFALRYYPPEQNQWGLWMSNAKGERHDITIADQLESGWHEFLIAWDHYKPELVFLIDGGRGGDSRSVSYLSSWPAYAKGEVFVGSWVASPQPYADSYCETRVHLLAAYDSVLDQSAAATSAQFAPLQGATVLPSSLPQSGSSLSAERSSVPQGVPVSFTSEGVNYRVDTPYPFLGSETTVSPDQMMVTRVRFAGGFQIRTEARPSQDMRVEFFRHGRSVSPILLRDQGRLLLPLGKPISVGSLSLDTSDGFSKRQSSNERVADRGWKIVPPGRPLETVISSDWPQGEKAYYVTTHVTYEGAELWIVQAPDNRPLQAWFYQDNRNVLPIVDEDLLSLAFPASPTPSGPTGPDVKDARHRLARILFLSANPLDSERIRFDEEMRSIEDALRQSDFRDQFDIVTHLAVRAVDIQGYLLRHRPAIVHFAGHGDKPGQIVLEDSQGNAYAVPPDALSQLFSTLKGNVRLVVLNSCYSESQAEGIAQSIDCVIGISGSVEDATATSFSRAFYQALGYGRNVKDAFDLGVVQVGLEGQAGQHALRLLAPRADPCKMSFVQQG